MPTGRPGRPAQGNDARLEISVSYNVDRALNQLVELSGVAKTTFVRQALLDMLSTLGLVYPEIAKSLKPTLTAGRTSTTKTQNRNRNGNKD